MMRGSHNLKRDKRRKRKEEGLGGGMQSHAGDAVKG